MYPVHTLSLEHISYPTLPQAFEALCAVITASLADDTLRAGDLKAIWEANRTGGNQPGVDAEEKAQEESDITLADALSRLKALSTGEDAACSRKTEQQRQSALGKRAGVGEVGSGTGAAGGAGGAAMAGTERADTSGTGADGTPEGILGAESRRKGSLVVFRDAEWAKAACPRVAQCLEVTVPRLLTHPSRSVRAACCRGCVALMEVRGARFVPDARGRKRMRAVHSLLA